MNKATQLLFLILFPFLPFWAWFFVIVRNTPVELFINVLMIPFVFYIIISPNIKFPKYLTFFALFTLYHLVSVYINHLLGDTNLIKYILRDKNFTALVTFFVIENTSFDEKFMKIMTRNIFVVVIISLLYSLYQLKNPSFFVSPYVLENQGNETFLTEDRIFSIYSWLNLNSLGISFPILIGILLSFFSHKKMASPIIIICGMIVSFLTKARYVMISTIIIFSQLFFTSKIKLSKKVTILLIFFGSILISFGAAKAMGYDIQKVIDERVLEKSTQMGSAKARVLSFYVFLEIFPEHPILGVGPETRIDVVRMLGGIAPIIHVGFLSYLYFYGLAGCFLLFLSLFYLLKEAWIIGTKYAFWTGFYGLIAFLMANTTMVYFNLSEMGIVLIVLYFRYFKETGSMELQEDN
jgi:hypothetical protein